MSLGRWDKSDLVSGFKNGVGGRNFNLGSLNQREGFEGLVLGVGGGREASCGEVPEADGRKERKRSCKETERGVEGEDAEGVEYREEEEAGVENGEEDVEDGVGGVVGVEGTV